MGDWRVVLGWKVQEFVSFEDLPNYLEPYQVWKDNDPSSQPNYLYVGNSELGKVESRYSMHLEGMSNVYAVIGIWTSYSPIEVEQGKRRPEGELGNWVWQYCEPYTLVADDWRELIGKESSLKLGWRQEQAPEEDEAGTIIASPELLASIGLPEELSDKRYVVFTSRPVGEFKEDMPQYRGAICVSSDNILSLYRFPYSHWYQFLRPG